MSRWMKRYLLGICLGDLLIRDLQFPQDSSFLLDTDSALEMLN
jgi:hypothetical protein